MNAEGDVAEGGKLRDTILYELKASREKVSMDLKKADSTGDYVKAMELATTAVRLQPDNPEFLYSAGLNAAILRHEKEASAFFKSYLDVSQSMMTERERKRRADVFGILPMLGASSQPPQGKANWFSGYNSPAGTLYCPVSLAPNARPASVAGSKKQTTTFEWRNNLLVSVETVAQGEGSSKIFFDYFPDGKAVRRLSTEAIGKEKDVTEAPRLTPEGAVGPGKGTWFVLYNHPVVSPYMVERLTGVRVATVVAGNPYFHPFVWTAIHEFLAEYDPAGRVRSAKEIHVTNGQPHNFDFEWEAPGLRVSIERGNQGDYRRDMHYSGDRIVEKTVHFQGKNSKIEYKWEGDRLVEAICDADASIDGRSRRVSFRE